MGTQRQGSDGSLHRENSPRYRSLYGSLFWGRIVISCILSESCHPVIPDCNIFGNGNLKLYERAELVMEHQIFLIQVQFFLLMITSNLPLCFAGLVRVMISGDKTDISTGSQSSFILCMIYY